MWLYKPRVYLQKFFKDCVFDLCELDGPTSVLCEAIEAYVNECQDRGVTIGPWRNETFCRKWWLNGRVEKWWANMYSDANFD